MTSYGTAADRVARARAASMSRTNNTDYEDNDPLYDTISDISTINSQGGKFSGRSYGHTPTPSPRPSRRSSGGSTRSSARRSKLVNHPIMTADTGSGRCRSISSGSRRGMDGDYLTYLGIHFDRDDNYVYSPGETLSGQIVMKTNERMFMAGLDFRLKGRVDIMLFNSKASYHNSEAFLYHCHRMIGVWDQKATQLEAGSYVSEFRYVLPNTLPSSITKLTTCQVRVIYGIQAVLTDMDNDTRQVTKMFTVRSLINKINPTPAFYSDEYESTSLRFKMDNTNLIIGKPGIITIESKLKFSEIQATLEQSIKTGPHQVKENLTRIRTRLDKNKDQHHNHVLKIFVPEHSMCDISRVTKVLEVNQVLHVKVKHKNTWINFKVPVKIHPAICQYGEDIPTFVGVKRYPTLDFNTSEQPIKIQVHFEVESWLTRKLGNLFR